MLIAVISDTHHGDKTLNFPSTLFKYIQNREPELILHAGDVTSPELLERLEELAPVLAVRGNADHLNLPEESSLEVEDLRIGIVHGHQFLALNSQFLTYKAMDMGVDVLIFGHTHRFYSDVTSFHGSRILLLNPGSPTFPRMDAAGFALLTVSGTEARVERVRFW